MKIDDRLKRIIFKKLSNDLSHVEIIPYKGDIWFIDRDKKYWYLELKKKGHLLWRFGFFEQFFQAFSLELDDYVSIIGDWVEDVLNHKVTTSPRGAAISPSAVEDVLNHKVTTSKFSGDFVSVEVEDVLNRKVTTSIIPGIYKDITVEQVLNHKVTTSLWSSFTDLDMVEEVLNPKVTISVACCTADAKMVEQVLNSN